MLRPPCSIRKLMASMGFGGSPASQTVKYRLTAWEAFRNATDIAPIRDEAHYQRMVAILEALLDEATGCQRRLNIEPPCRFNIEPGRVANSLIGNCG